MRKLVFVIWMSFSVNSFAQVPPDQQPFECPYCDAWNESTQPYQLASNSWFVGTAGLSSILIVDSGELALIDGTLPQSVEQILANIESIGFDPQAIKWILSSHAHYDHAGGLAAMERITGATVVAGERAVVGLTKGPYHPDDPQAGFGESARFPSVHEVFPVEHGDVIQIGNTSITAVATPGHTPGGMTWTWKACSEDTECRDVVYLDSLSAVSAPDYRFIDHPDTVAELKTSIERVAELSCDIAIAAHPTFTPDAEADVTICAVYADQARQGLARRLEKEAEQVSNN